MANSKAQPGTLAILPLVIVPVAFLASGLWLKAAFGSTVTIGVAVAAAVFVLGYSNYLFPRARRGK